MGGDCGSTWPCLGIGVIKLHLLAFAEPPSSILTACLRTLSPAPVSSLPVPLHLKHLFLISMLTVPREAKESESENKALKRWMDTVASFLWMYRHPRVGCKEMLHFAHMSGPPALEGRMQLNIPIFVLWSNDVSQVLLGSSSDILYLN